MMTLAGHRFLTEFKTNQLIEQLNSQAALKVTGIDTQQVYVLSRDLNDAERKKALDLLNQGEEVDQITATQGQCQVIVSPRFGTISPWSSKATDIFNNCDLDVERVERVIVFTLTGDNLPAKLPKEAEQILHDRMTQSLVYEFAKLDQLFDDHSPARLNHIDVIGEGRAALEA